MSFISAGIAGAGLALQVGSQAGLFGGKGGRPAFDYGGAQSELDHFNKQIAAQKEYLDRSFAETERQKASVAAERDRQLALTGEANKSLQHEQGLYSDVPGQMAGKTKSLADFFATNSSALPAGGPTAPNAMPAFNSPAVAADATAKMGRVADYNAQQGKALAGMRSFGDVWGDLENGSLQDKSHMTNLLNFKQGSKSLLPAELQPAYNLTPPPTPSANFGQYYSEAPSANLFPTIAAGVGNVATSAGLSGWNPFGGGFSGTPAGLATYGSPGYPGSSRYGGPR